MKETYWIVSKAIQSQNIHAIPALSSCYLSKHIPADKINIGADKLSLWANKSQL